MVSCTLLCNSDVISCAAPGGSGGEFRHDFVQCPTELRPDLVQIRRRVRRRPALPPVPSPALLTTFCMTFSCPDTRPCDFLSGFVDAVSCEACPVPPCRHPGSSRSPAAVRTDSRRNSRDGSEKFRTISCRSSRFFFRPSTKPHRNLPYPSLKFRTSSSRTFAAGEPTTQKKDGRRNSVRSLVTFNFIPGSRPRRRS